MVGLKGYRMNKFRNGESFLLCNYYKGDKGVL